MEEKKEKGSRPLEMTRRNQGGESVSGTGGQCEGLRGAGKEGEGKRVLRARVTKLPFPGGGEREVQARPGQLCKETGEGASRPTSVPLSFLPLPLESAPCCLSASASSLPETAKVCTTTLEEVLSGL